MAMGEYADDARHCLRAQRLVEQELLAIKENQRDLSPPPPPPP